MIDYDFADYDQGLCMNKNLSNQDLEDDSQVDGVQRSL